MPLSRNISRKLLALFFIIAGLGHFLIPSFYLQMMPGYLPYPLTLIFLSGLAEIIFGILAFIPQCYRLAKYGMILLLLAVFPANINMALHPELFPGFSAIGLWIRLPFQALFIFWILFSFKSK